MDVVTMNKPLVLIDWGTTNFRAYLLEEGIEKDVFNSGNGMAKLDKQGMAGQITELVGHWKLTDANIYACGMIGSSVGWQDVPYVQCPVDKNALANGIQDVDFDGISVRLIPGVKYQTADADWDVMRGEELQAIGWAETQLVQGMSNSGLCVMPGTHSKWAQINEGCVTSFFTSITGELFALMRQHGLLRHHLIEDFELTEAFDKGLQLGANEQGLGRHLFSVRSNSLLKGLAKADASAFVSGLLIGSEVADAVRMYQCRDGGTVNIIGASRFEALYSRALAHFDVPAVFLDSHAASVAGFLAIDKLLS